MPPKISGAPGLGWRRRTDHWVALWIARGDIVKRGYPVKSVRLWPPAVDPRAALTDDVTKLLRSECARLQDEMLGWDRGGDVATIHFDGTVRGLIECYRRDPDSAFHKLRYESKRSYNAHLRMIEATVGARALAALKARDFLRWFDNWARPDHDKDRRHVARAHARITLWRIVLKFGAGVLEDAHCARLSAAISQMQFENARARTSYMTPAQAVGIRAAAHAAGFPSIALGQALQFELMLRPKDVIGEWVPIDEPGLSQVTAHGMKWICGVDWREVSDGLVLEHRMSKSLRGRNALADSRAGKLMTFDLRRYPMVMQELALIPAERRTGPLVTDETTGIPYRTTTYRDRWRAIATAAGVPTTIQNRDSRAGGITEGVDASGGDVEAVRHAAGHSQISTTQLYSRAADRQIAKVADFRSAKRGGKEGA